MSTSFTPVGKKTNNKQSSKQKQKQNVINDDEELGFGTDSRFSALSNMDNKEEKKINESNNNSNKDMRKSFSNNNISSASPKNSPKPSPKPSPKTSKKNTNSPPKTAPIQELSKLIVSDYIRDNIKISDNEEDQIEQLKKFCNFIETEITNKLYCATVKFSHKSFDIDDPKFKGPISYLNSKQRKEIENLFLKCKESVITKLFILITKCIIVGEKKASNNPNISNTIAHQLCVQIISNLYPGILYKHGKEGKLVYEQIIGHHKENVENSLAVGNTLIWVSKQQQCDINKKKIYCPEYVSLWMNYFVNLFASNNSPIVMKTQSVKLLNQVLDGINENKNNLKINVPISFETFVVFIAILKSENLASQIKKHDKLYSGISKAYDTIKSLLFNKNSNILSFELSNREVFTKICKKILSDPTYDLAVFNEFLKIIVLTIAKEPSLFDVWDNSFCKNQPKYIPLSNAIVKEIKNQQAEYFKSKKYCPDNNCWKELDNNYLRNTFYNILGYNDQYRNKENEDVINEMNKNIRIILSKTTRSQDSDDDGFFSGFLMKLLKRFALLVIILCFSLHVLDSVDRYNVAKNGPGKVKLPASHPVVTDKSDYSKCPYTNFRNKYTNCRQCHPVVKYVYDFMDEPYKYVEQKAIIPAYEKIWKPYCSRAFMLGLEYGYIPAYRKLKPIIREKVMQPLQEKVVQPVQENVVPRVTEVYDAYAKEYVDKANENVVKPAFAAGSKYAKQAYVVIKPATIKAKDYIIDDVVKPSIPYVNKAKVKAIQYGNEFLDLLADIPYKRITKNCASSTLRVIGRVENNMEKFYVYSKPYYQKYWDVLSRKTNAVIEQESVQNILNNPYVKTSTDAIKDAYRIWSEGVKVTYVYLTGRGPEEGGIKNWKDATDKVSIKKDIRSSIDLTKRFFKDIIDELDREDETESFPGENKKRTVKVVKGDSKGSSLPVKNTHSPKLSPELQKKKAANGYKVVKEKKVEQESSKAIKEEKKEPSTKAIKEEKVKEEKAKEEKVKKEKAKEEKVKEKREQSSKAIKEEKKEPVAKKTTMVNDKVKPNPKKNVDNVSKQLAKERAMIKAEVKRVIKEDFEKNVVHKLKEKRDNNKENPTKKIAKIEAETTKQIIKEKASNDPKQVAVEHVEATKQLAKEEATKQLIKEHLGGKQMKEEQPQKKKPVEEQSEKKKPAESNSKQIIKEKAMSETTKEVIKDKVNTETKKVIKEKLESTKKIIKDKAMTDAKQVVKEHAESTKQLALDNALKE